MIKQNINIGDKLLCKNDLITDMIYDDTLTDMISFIKGKYYEVYDIRIIEDKYTVVDMKDYNDTYFYFFISELNKDFSFWYAPYFYEYFYTKNELRTMKLDKLKDRNTFKYYEKSES